MNDDQKPEVQETSQQGTSDSPEVKVESSQEGNDTTVQVPSGTQESSEKQSQPQNDTPETQRNIDAEKGKISTLERERNDYSKKYSEAQKRTEELEKVRNTVNELFAEDPQAYERWRQKWIAAGNQDLGTYQQLYGGQQTQGNYGQQVNQQPASQGPVDPNQVYQQAYQAGRQAYQEEKVYDGMTSFLKENPEIDPAQVDRGTPEYEQRAAQLNRLVEMARMFQSWSPNLTVKEAFDRANKSMNVDQALEKERRTGEVIGKAQVAANNATSSGAISGGGNKGSYDTITLSPSQKAHYDSIKARSGKKVADLFARNVAGK